MDTGALMKQTGKERIKPLTLEALIVLANKSFSGRLNDHMKSVYEQARRGLQTEEDTIFLVEGIRSELIRHRVIRRFINRQGVTIEQARKLFKLTNPNAREGGQTQKLIWNCVKKTRQGFQEKVWGLSGLAKLDLSGFPERFRLEHQKGVASRACPELLNAEACLRFSFCLSEFEAVCFLFQLFANTKHDPERQEVDLELQDVASLISRLHLRFDKKETETGRKNSKRDKQCFLLTKLILFQAALRVLNMTTCPIPKKTLMAFLPFLMEEETRGDNGFVETFQRRIAVDLAEKTNNVQEAIVISRTASTVSWRYDFLTKYVKRTYQITSWEDYESLMAQVEDVTNGGGALMLLFKNAAIAGGLDANDRRFWAVR